MTTATAPPPPAPPPVDSPGGEAPPEPHRRRFSRRSREAFYALVLLVPSIVVFGVFSYYPFVRTVRDGMFQTNRFGTNETYVGFDQYWDVLTSPTFHNSLEVTGLFALYTVIPGMILGLGLALLANQRLRGIGIFRTIFSSTVATSVAVASVMWITLLNPQIGLINYYLDTNIDLLNSPTWALVAVSATTVWLSLGVTFIVMSAGLQGVPDDLLEAATVDGAGPWTRFRRVTFPLLSPTLLFSLVVLTINAFQSFGQVELLTGGGPNNKTDVIVFNIVSTSRQVPGRAAAQAVVLFVIILVLTLVQLKFLERRVYYGGGADE